MRVHGPPGLASIASFQDRELIALRVARRATEDALHCAMKEATGSVVAALVAQPRALMDLVDAGGVAVVENGEPVTCGGVPTADVIREIARWLEERGDLRPFSSASSESTFRRRSRRATSQVVCSRSRCQALG